MKNALRGMLFCIGVCVAISLADTLYVAGTVSDSATGALISGAVVTVQAGSVRFGGGGGGAGGRVSGLYGVDTTGTDGSYSIMIPNDTSATARVSATAANYRSNVRGQTITIANPKDGIADHFTVNIILAAGSFTGGGGTGDTVVLTGTVTDSAGNPADSATVSVERTGAAGAGFGGAASRAVVTGTNGTYSLTFKGDSNGIVLITATSRSRGTGSAEVIIAQPKDGVTDHATANVKLGVIYGEAPGDSVTISGTVTDSAGNPVDSASISIRVGNAVGVTGTGATGAGARILTGSSGTYSVTVRGDTSGIVVVTATKGRSTGAAQVKVAAPNDGTTDQETANISFVRRSAVLRPLSPARRITGTSVVAVYSLDGRLLNYGKSGAMRRAIHQTVIYRIVNNSGEKNAVSEKTIELK